MVLVSTLLKGMNAKQTAWWNEMNAVMDAVRDAWHYDRRLAQSLFTDKIQADLKTACERLNIDIATAWDPDGWDGEEDPAIITAERRVVAIQKTLAGEPIPADWSVSYEQALQALDQKRAARRR